VHCSCDNFKPYHESIAKVLSKDAGGKGVNISRALQANGTENLAIVVVGKENGVEFCKALEDDGMNVASIWVEGRIRENITLHEENNPETRISFEGFTCDSRILEDIKEKIGKVNGQTIVTFTGSIPKGIKVEEVLALLSSLRAQGAKIVIDSRSVSLADLIAFKPWLIKPNKDEAEAYANRKIQSVSDAIMIARDIYEKGIDNAIVSLGGEGAVFAYKRGVMVAKAPSVPVCSTIGAGDSMLAGFIDGTSKGANKEKVFKRAVAFGTAACKQEGTKPPSANDVEELIKMVKVKHV
jgi:1-phosphofructokinase family hexose kinase